MQTSDKANLIEALHSGSVTVTFKKINSDEIRVMPCTLNPVVLEANDVYLIDKVTPESDNIAVWSTDKNAWRSFRTNTVTNWEVL